MPVKYWSSPADHDRIENVIHNDTFLRGNLTISKSNILFILKPFHYASMNGRHHIREHASLRVFQ